MPPAPPAAPDASGARPQLIGILNVTPDSFSDGGRFLAPEAAVDQGRRLREAGADVVELGPASSHPDAAAVPASEEIRRLVPVVEKLAAEGIPLGLDSFQPDTQAWALARGFAWLNDTRGFPEPEQVQGLARAECRLCVMHALQRDGRARRQEVPVSSIVAQVERFFDRRLQVLARAGVARERLVLDPGMGFFVGATPEPSLALLRALPRLRARYRLPLLVSVSRKSFLQRLTGRPASATGAATLAAELYAAAQGADYIRTHEPGPLRDALAVRAALGGL